MTSLLAVFVLPKIFQEHRIKETFVDNSLITSLHIDQSQVWLATASKVEIANEFRIVTFVCIILEADSVALHHLKSIEATAPDLARYLEDRSLNDERVIFYL